MQVGVPRETRAGETRVALTPEAVKKLVTLDATVVVESGAGDRAHASDQQYEEAGANIATGDGEPPAAVWGESDVVVTVNPPSESQVAQMKRGAVLIGLLDALRHPQLMQACADAGVTAFAMELMPRISRAQAMDVLSSQANIAGYKAMLLAADHAPKMMPMMITAAGTLAPAKAFTIGAGVAGLQAIATGRRLGAVVEAHDVRPTTKEQVQSLGARFIELGDNQQQSETASGYAREQSEPEQARQREALARHLTASDVIVSTAAVFGKAPPMIISTDIVERMQPGTVIVDLAADAEHGRGNCENTRPGETYTNEQGVTIVGTLDLPTLLPVHASQVLANNLLAFVKTLIAEGELSLNLDDQLQRDTAVTHDGQIVNDTARQTLSG